MTFHDQSGADSMPPDHHYPHHNEASGDDGDFFDNHPVFEAIFCYGWLFFLFYCMCCRNRQEPPSTEVGDRIRARAREAQESIQQKKIKEEQSPEERKRIVDENMICKVVLTKDSKGNLTLGNTHSQEASDEDDVEAQQTDADDSKNLTHLEADDEEGLTCVICLDCFEPDDMVSWTKHDPTCTHVFHDECIRQWLEERRQDECPSCRCHLVPPVEVPPTKSLDEESDEEEEMADTDADSSAASSAQPKEDDADSALFVTLSELLSMATRASSTRSPPSAPASGNYNLVSVNSSSFDSRDAPELVQDPEDPPQHQPLDAESPLSSSSDDDDDDEESNQQQFLSPNDFSISLASVDTMSISEALRQSEAMEDDDGEEMGGAMELDLQDAVTQIPFSSP